jgi:S-methylmethionine-dependent homocysteine/selenocysteine methylase
VAEGWQQRLERGGTLVLDGGTGTELRRRGMALSRATWSALASLTQHDLLRTIHSDYIAAGADVITTNTFATTRFVLEAAGHGDDVTLINTRAVAAARAARENGGRDVAIAGSISCLPPRFDVHAYPAERVERAAYLELAETLAEAGVDLLVLEMLQETRHAPLACEAARTVGLPVWLGVSCRLGAGGALVGFDFPLVPLATCLEALLPFAPAVVNVMHSPVGAVEPALREIRAHWPGQLGAYPEIGDGADAATQALEPPALAALARGWIAAGARVVGGCCGTTPAHVRALASVREALVTPVTGSGRPASALDSRAARPDAPRSRDTSA